jgi:hypothetical protein
MYRFKGMPGIHHGLESVNVNVHEKKDTPS